MAYYNSAEAYRRLTPEQRAQKNRRDRLYYSIPENKERAKARIKERYEKDPQFREWKKYYNRERIRKVRALERAKKAQENGQEQPTQISEQGS